MRIIKIVTIMDNLPSEHKALRAEHGLSFCVETEELRVLFDFGAGAHALANAEALGVPLRQMDYALCSHGHYDHAGGYPHFVRGGLTCPLVTGAGFFREKYALDGARATYLGTGFSEEFLAEHQIRHLICGQVLQLSDHCWVLSSFERKREFETIPKRFVLREADGFRQDLFEDEICLVIEEAGELTVILGCSHPGILNILDQVQRHFQKPIRAVAGGTHLVEADRERIDKTLSAMKEMGVRLIGFNHCSGPLLRERLADRTDLNAVYLGAGDCLFL